MLFDARCTFIFQQFGESAHSRIFCVLNTSRFGPTSSGDNVRFKNFEVTSCLRPIHARVRPIGSLSKSAQSLHLSDIHTEEAAPPVRPLPSA